MRNLIFTLITLAPLLTISLAAQCGTQAGGALCPNGLCCSQWGFCGSEAAWCGEGCQSQCWASPPPPPPPTTPGRCGTQAGGALCPNGLCCSREGWCGSTAPWCGEGCQSQCWGTPPPAPATPAPPPAPITPTPPTPPPSPIPSPGGTNISSIISESLFEEMLPYRNDPRCPSNGFYTYNAFITAAQYFNGFGTTGDINTRKREIAAFFGQTSHETTGGWATAPGGPFAWGYCFIREVNPPGDYCSSTAWPCPAGRRYYGRGPIQLTHNYNYGLAGNALRLDLIDNPDLVATDAFISFETAIWFWMTPQYDKPSCHDVITGGWTPSSADIAAGRLPGYGVITNIINGGLECGRGTDARVENRIGFYKRYCDLFGLDYGDNLDCNNQRPFGGGVATDQLISLLIEDI